MGLELSEHDADRLARVLEAQGETLTTHRVLLAKIEANMEREAAMLERLLDKVDANDARIDELEKRQARSDGWRSAVAALAGGGTALGGGKLMQMFFGG